MRSWTFLRISCSSSAVAAAFSGEGSSAPAGWARSFAARSDICRRRIASTWLRLLIGSKAWGPIYGDFAFVIIQVSAHLVEVLARRMEPGASERLDN